MTYNTLKDELLNKERMEATQYTKCNKKAFLDLKDIALHDYRDSLNLKSTQTTKIRYYIDLQDRLYNLDYNDNLDYNKVINIYHLLGENNAMQLFIYLEFEVNRVDKEEEKESIGFLIPFVIWLIAMSIVLNLN